MKSIAIFCDGTWQKLDQRWPTNVAKLARAVLPRGADGEVQVVHYDDGVGVGEGILNTATQLIGGALGRGLDYKIATAYEFLCLNYEPGDRVYLFGFSRGAYTARSLAGLLRLMWILKREEASAVFEATRFYRLRPRDGAEPDEQAAFDRAVADFRAAHCYPATPFLDPRGADPMHPTSATPESDASLQYVGVWDTVGALGVPTSLPLAMQINARYQFHDLSLSRFVRSARHAVAIDERRETYTPTLWDNIDRLNTNAGGDTMPLDRRPYQQLWFPGVHSGVGGGMDDGGLSLGSLLWIAEGAARAGLALDEDELRLYARDVSPGARFQHGGFGVGDLIVELIGMRDRIGPARFEQVSLPARLRWARVEPAYRPAPLRHQPEVEDALNHWAVPHDPQGWYLP